MGHEDVILRIGKIGRFQRRILLVFFLPMISCAFHKMGGVFLSAKADFRCLLPNETPENATYQSPPKIVNITDQWNDGTEIWPKCEKYDPGTPDAYNTSSTNLSSTSTAAKCDSFVYDKTHYTLTVTTQWNLVCDSAWLRTLGDSLFMLGDMPGVVIWGALSDKYGRKIALLWGTLMQLVCGLLVAVSPNFETYIVFRVLVGATTSGLPAIAVVTAIEMVSPKNRMKVGTIMNLSFATACIVTPCLAYFIRKWRILQTAFTIPTFILLAFWWSIPESVRWLLSKGRVREAKDILRKASSENGTKLSQDTLDGLLGDDSRSKSNIENGSLIDLMRYPNLRKRSLLLFFIWFINSITYYGLSFNTSNLGGNDYLNFLFVAAVEVPAYVFLLFTLNKLGRKIIACGCLFLAGSSLLLTFFVPADMTWTLKILAMIGKLAVTAAWGAFYIFTTELYPTAVRNVGFATCSGFARLGGALAPVIDHLFAISTTLPLVVLGLSAMVAGLFSLLLPETLNQKLPETIQDSEEFGKRDSRTNNKPDV